MPPKLLEPSRKRARQDDQPQTKPDLPWNYQQWPKALKTALQKADQILATFTTSDPDDLFVVIDEKREFYGGDTEFEIWGIFKTLQSANRKAAERFVRECVDAMDDFREDGAFLGDKEQNGRYQYVVRVDKRG